MNEGSIWKTFFQEKGSEQAYRLINTQFSG